MSKHTPGPWRYFQDPCGHSWFEVEGKPGLCIATVHSYPNVSGLMDTEANARLIATAPDLLKTLEAANACFNGQHNLLSTATDDERRVVVENFLNWWNSKALPLLERIEGGD